jgi:hypothetical protein
MSWGKMSGRYGRGVCVDRIPNVDSGTHRALWLAELAGALDAARHVAKEYELEGLIEAIDIYGRIESAGSRFSH